MSYRAVYAFRGLFTCVMLAVVSVSLGSCGVAKNQFQHDRSAEKEIQDYRDMLSPPAAPAKDAEAQAPDFKPIVAVPADLKLPAPLVTVSVNQTVPLRDLLFELADQAGVDLELDPQIRGSLIFTAKDRPFNEVVDRLCDMSGLRYTFDNNVLHIELDRPYIKTYHVDYMNIMRKSDTSIHNDISTSGAGGGSGGGSGGPQNNGGSTASIDNSYSSDTWKEMDEGLNQILLASDTYQSMATSGDPVTIVTPAPAGAPSNNPPSINVQQPAAAAATPATGSLNPPATYSISKQTGTVNVFATGRQQKQVEKFLDHLGRMLTTQVLIEAKVLEVSLTDEYASGIDWGTLTDSATHNGLTASFGSPGMTPTAGSVFTGTINLGSGVQPVISALSRFGTVRSLSSPRVTVMNNQPAVVNVAEDLVYFTVQVTQTPSTAVGGGPPTITYATTQQSVPEGVLLNVVPTVNPDTGSVILAVRPTVTKKTTDVEDPVIKLNNPTATITSKIPQISIQQMDSIVKLQSGQTIVMGGLMRDQNTVSHEGVPILDSIPYLGESLFGNHGDRIAKTELVIFLKSTVIPGAANADDTDKKLYKQFGQDRHPSAL